MPFAWPSQADSLGFTAGLARLCASARLVDLDEDEREIAHQAILDWYGVTLAGAREPILRPLYDEILSDATHQEGAEAIGHAATLPPAAAALLNGAASHVLDFDDAHPAVNGHASAPVLAAAIALAHARGASGAELVEAYVCGLEVLCRVARMLGDVHFARGFHVTATAGVIGAAAACARLLGLDAAHCERAFGLAATQACGLQAVFGSPAKPFNVGRAAQSGLMSARLAARGMHVSSGVLEPGRAMARAYADGGCWQAGSSHPPLGSHLRSNLFKYHAACFMAHATIDGATQVREQAGLQASQVARCVLRVEADYHRVCAIDWPAHDLEGKFSLRYCAALALSGLDTARTESYLLATARRSELVSLAERIEVQFDPGMSQYSGDIDVVTHAGARYSATVDVSEPCADRARQEGRLRQKFRSLNEDHLGQPACDEVIERILAIERCDNVRDLLG